MMYPKRNTEHAAGFDIILPKSVFLLPNWTTRIPLSFRIAKCPVGHYFLMCERSSFAIKFPTLFVRGIVDCDYRGEVYLLVTNLETKAVNLDKGDCVAQMVLTKCACTCEVGMKTVAVAFREEDADEPTVTQTTVEKRGEQGTSFPLQQKDAMNWVYDEHAGQEQEETIQEEEEEIQDEDLLEGLTKYEMGPEKVTTYVIADEEEEEEVPTIKTLIINTGTLDADVDDVILVDCDALEKKQVFLDAVSAALDKLHGN